MRPADGRSRGGIWRRQRGIGALVVGRRADWAVGVIIQIIVVVDNGVELRTEEE